MTRRGIAIDYLRDEAALAPFHHIIDQGNEEMLKVVLKKFSAVDARDMLGYTALHWAAARPWVEGAKLLIQAGADVNKPSLYNDITAVHMAATGGSAEILQMLEEKGAKLDVKTTDGMSPLWMASLRAHSEAIKFFLDHNTETDIIDPLTGNTLLHLVASSGTVETFSMLHKTKGCADAITKRNKAGDTPFHIAVRKNSLEVASYIAEHGGAAFDQGSRKVGLVELAVTYDEPALLSFLIGLGADIKADYARLQEIASRHETNKVAEILAASNFAGAAGIKV
jgi:ankyrin repeat protein